MVWRLLERDEDVVDRLAEELGLPRLVAGLLANRGVRSVEDAHLFLSPGKAPLHDPALLADMPQAVERVARALRGRERIVVYGDYDVDGLTSTALMATALRDFGGEVSTYVPDRLEEGYGLNAEAVEKLAAGGADLIVTVDCGVCARQEVARAAALGVDVVVTDHHVPQAILPPAHAVVNPKRIDCPYPFNDLAGVGVAYKLACALAGEMGEDSGLMDRFADLVGLGTVADVMPLIGENRALVDRGLRALSVTSRPGLRALAREAGLDGGEVTARQVAFQLAPRLNAGGRLGDAGSALSLLLCSDPEAAVVIAGRLELANRRRQHLQDGILEEALSMLEADPSLGESGVIVLAREGWHQGVVGIVASKLVDRLGKPVILLCVEEGRARGSGRSVDGFDLYGMVSKVSEMLSAYGGHAMAVGLSLPAERVDGLRDALSEIAAVMPEISPELSLDAEISLEEVRPGLPRLLALLEPYGTGNEPPLFLVRSVVVRGRPRVVGKGHLKFNVEQGNRRIGCIGFGLSERSSELGEGPVDLAARVRVDQWLGVETLCLEVEDIRPAGVGQ